MGFCAPCLPYRGRGDAAPVDDLRGLLGGVDRVAVLDRNISPGHGGIFAEEIRSALYDVPLLTDLQPAGRFLGEDFHRAGGVPARYRHGALAEGDIGTHLPPSDPEWRGADSAIFLRRAVERAGELGVVGDVGHLAHAAAADESESDGHGRRSDSGEGL